MATQLNSVSEPKIIYIVGPTASGKTALSIELAQKLNGEIICADSQTIRRDMTIGTAKPSLEEQQGIPHHMIDVINPYDDFNLAYYIEKAQNIISNIQNMHKTAIIVGGTGLYIDALYYNFSLPRTGDDHWSGLSIEELQSEILARGYDMPSNDKNPRHLINTLRRSGGQGSRGEPDTDAVIVGLNPGREVLVHKINARVEAMFDGGFLDEVRSIIKTYGLPPKEFDAIGYRIAMRHLNGEITIDEAKELFKIADRQYARRQMSWFRRNSSIRWFESAEDAKSYILDICEIS